MPITRLCSQKVTLVTVRSMTEGTGMQVGAYSSQTQGIMTPREWLGEWRRWGQAARPG